MTEQRHAMHLAIAEHGKLCLLRGDCREALRHFREAMRLSVSAQAPEVFFRHYTQCTLEALERQGSHAEVAAWCEAADEHYAALALEDSFHRKDHGAIIERLALARLHDGDAEAARVQLERAVERAGPGVLPLAQELLGWLKRGFAVSAARVAQLQKRHGYFVVRADQVDVSLAQELPPETARAPAAMLA